MKHIYIVISILLVFGCNENHIEKVGEGKRIIVDVEKAKQELELTKYFTPEYITLEVTENALVGEASKVYITKSAVYVLDNDVANAFFIFNRDGSFVKKIGSIGKGPGEYLVLDDFAIDEVNKEIHLYAGDQKRILIYNIDGKFKRMIKLSDFGYTFNLFPSGKYLSMNTTNLKNASFWNEKGERTSFFNQEDNLSWFPRMSISKFDSTCLIRFPYYGEIYQVEGEKLIEKFHIDFQIKNFPMESIKDREKLKNLVFSGEYASLRSFAYYNDILCFRYDYNKTSGCGLFFNETDELILSKRFMLEGIPFYTIGGICKEGIILQNNASFLLQYKDRVLEEDFDLPDYYTSISENSNPVITLLKTKL